MNRSSRRGARFSYAVLLVVGALCAGCGGAPSTDQAPVDASLGAARAGDLDLSGGWATEAPAPTTGVRSSTRHMSMDMSASSAAYFTLRDRGGADSLASVTSPEAARVELHATSTGSDGTSGTMVRVGHLDIPASGRTVLRPGGYHLMLIDPRAGLAAGDGVHLVLRFRSGVTMRAVLPVLDREDRPGA